MNHASIHRWQHSHVFDQGNPTAQRRTRWAVWLTAIMMVAEIVGGWWYNSMALLADGWHMSSHALALRSEEHTSELQSLMRISYAVFCLKKKKTNNHN